MKQLNAMTDEELAMEYMSGNDYAFDKLLERYKEKVFKYIDCRGYLSRCLCENYCGTQGRKVYQQGIFQLLGVYYNSQHTHRPL